MMPKRLVIYYGEGGGRKTEWLLKYFKVMGLVSPKNFRVKGVERQHKI